jgi:hypothetical protein
MNSLLHTLYLMILFTCTHFSLFAMQPHGLARAHRCVEKLFAHALRPGHVHVFMNDAKAITLAPDAQKNITISTSGLIGCTATLLYAKDHAAYQHAILMHYHPDYHKEHLAELERQIYFLSEHAKLFKSIKFLSIMPEDNYWLDQALHTADCNERRKALVDIVQKSSLCSPINIHHTTYNLAPPGKGYYAEVHATLSHNTPSKCKVIHWAGSYNDELE